MICDGACWMWIILILDFSSYAYVVLWCLCPKPLAKMEAVDRGGADVQCQNLNFKFWYDGGGQDASINHDIQGPPCSCRRISCPCSANLGWFVTAYSLHWLAYIFFQSTQPHMNVFGCCLNKACVLWRTAATQYWLQCELSWVWRCTYRCALFTTAIHRNNPATSQDGIMLFQPGSCADPYRAYGAVA